MNLSLKNIITEKNKNDNNNATNLVGLVNRMNPFSSTEDSEPSEGETNNNNKNKKQVLNIRFPNCMSDTDSEKDFYPRRSQTKKNKRKILSLKSQSSSSEESTSTTQENTISGSNKSTNTPSKRKTIKTETETPKKQIIQKNKLKNSFYKGEASSPITQVKAISTSENTTNIPNFNRKTIETQIESPNKQIIQENKQKNQCAKISTPLFQNKQSQVDCDKSMKQTQITNCNMQSSSGEMSSPIIQAKIISTLEKTTNTPNLKRKTIETQTESPKKQIIQENKQKTQCAKLRAKLFQNLQSQVGCDRPMKQSRITNFFECNKSKKNEMSAESSNLKKTKISKNKQIYSKENHERVLENVKNIVNWVLQHEFYNILFIKSECDLLKKLLEMPNKQITVLCIRLFTRQHKWYKLYNLCETLMLTDDNFNLGKFLLVLSDGFVITDYSDENVDVLLENMSHTDVKEICEKFNINTKSTKYSMINRLMEHYRTQQTLSNKNPNQILMRHVREKLGKCVKMDTEFRKILNRVHLLYALTSPDLKTPNEIYNFMNDIKSGQIQLPKPEKIDFIQVFPNRENFIRYADAIDLYRNFEYARTWRNHVHEQLLCSDAFKCLTTLLTDDKQLELDEEKPLYLRRFTASWVYCKVLTTGSLDLGNKYPDEVCVWLTEMIKQKVYCPYKRGLWYTRLALIRKEYKKDFNGEAQTIIDGLSDETVTETFRYDLSNRGLKVKQVNRTHLKVDNIKEYRNKKVIRKKVENAKMVERKKVTQLIFDDMKCLLLPELEMPEPRVINALATSSTISGKKKVYKRRTAENDEYSSVEQTAIDYYVEKEDYNNGVHCEGRIIDFLFTIFFWDVLYMHVPNTFLTEIQQRPLDLYTVEFYPNRRQKIDEILEFIREKSLEEVCDLALKVFTDNSQKITISHYNFSTENFLKIIIKCMGKNVIAAILERLVKDFQQFHSGFPDLFLWNETQSKSCFVEVKSNNDRLSTTQMLWINYLRQIGAQVEVCHVKST